MWSRRAACESITTRRRFFAGPFLAAAAAPSPAVDPSAGFVADDFVPAAFAFVFSAFAGDCLAAGFGLVGVAGGVAPAPEPLPGARGSGSPPPPFGALASAPAAL